MVGRADESSPQRNLPSILVLHMHDEAGLRKKSSVNSFGSTDLPDARLWRGRAPKMEDHAVSVSSRGVFVRSGSLNYRHQERWLRPHRLQSFMVIQEILTTIQSGLMRKCRDEQRARVIHLIHCRVLQSLCASFVSFQFRSGRLGHCLVRSIPNCVQVPLVNREKMVVGTWSND